MAKRKNVTGIFRTVLDRLEPRMDSINNITEENAGSAIYCLCGIEEIFILKEN